VTRYCQCVLLSLTACGRLGFEPSEATRSVDAGGHPFGSAAISSPGLGIVLIMPAANGQNEGGCIADGAIAFGSGGITVDVARTTAAASGYTALRTSSTGVQLEDRGGVFALRDATTVYAQTAFDPIAMRWWRLRPDMIGATVVADVSPDGTTWTQFASTSTPPPSQVVVELVAGVATMESVPGESMFSHIGF